MMAFERTVPMPIARIAKFSKVSFGQFEKDWLEIYPDAKNDGIKEIYDNIKLPLRATAGSAGYDFFLPQSISLAQG
jgi:dUTP pyrophosphatase